MSVQCISCRSFSLKRVPAADALNGFGHCELREAFIRHAALTPRVCGDHKQAGANVIKARHEWIGRHRG